MFNRVNFTLWLAHLSRALCQIVQEWIPQWYKRTQTILHAKMNRKTILFFTGIFVFGKLTLSFRVVDVHWSTYSLDTRVRRDKENTSRGSRYRQQWPGTSVLQFSVPCGVSDRCVFIYCQCNAFPFSPHTSQASKPARCCKRTTSKFKTNFLKNEAYNMKIDILSFSLFFHLKSPEPTWHRQIWCNYILKFKLEKISVPPKNLDQPVTYYPHKCFEPHNDCSGNCVCHTGGSDSYAIRNYDWKGVRERSSSRVGTSQGRS